MLQSQNNGSVEIEWHVPREQVKAVQEKLNFSSNKITADLSTLDDTKGLPLIYIFLGAVSLSLLAKSLLDLYRDIKYGGIVIRNEKGKLKIENDSRLSGGTIVIQQKDKFEVIFREKDGPNINELMKAIEPLLKK